MSRRVIAALLFMKNKRQSCQDLRNDGLLTYLALRNFPSDSANKAVQ
jgi:hypothetical protein